MAKFREAIRSGVRHPHFLVYVVFFWIFWMVFKVLPDRGAGNDSSLLLLSVLTLVVFAIPLALYFTIFIFRK